MTRILLVDDLFENQEILAEIMTGFGFEYSTAGCVQGAVELATTQDFDAVIMDLGIPYTENGQLNVMGGLEASRTILAHPHSKDLPIIAFTNRRVKDVEHAVLEAGLRAVLEKGPKMDERLLSMLRTLLNLPATASSSTIESFPATSQPAPKLTAIGELYGDTETATAVFVEAEERVTLTVQSARTGSLEQNPADSFASATLPEFQPNIVVTNPKLGLTDAFLKILHSAQSQASQLQQEVMDPDVSTSIAPILSKLHKHLAEAIKRLDDPADGPAIGEPFGHWIGSLILGAHRSCTALASSDHDNFEKFASAIAGIQHELDSAYELSRTDAAQSIPRPRPLPAKGLLRSNGSASTAFPIRTRTHQATSQRQPPDVTAILETATPQVPTSEIPAPLILVVDDESEAREDLETKLRERNEYQVVSCNDPLTALKLMELMPIDVCLLDLSMPGMDGLELIDQLRSSPKTSNTSIIVVSGSQKAVEAIERGADDYITKPADSALLSARIKSCLRKTRARIEELSKFLPTHVLKSVLSNSMLLEQAIPADISVIVCDIRGFSRVSERIGPVQTIAWVSDVMNRLSQVILSNGGTIVDYVGDEIMAMWGAPIATTCHAEQACRCAMAIQAEVDCLVKKWQSKIHCDFSIGIGINSGLAVVGNTGSKLRFKYGPLGDTVNVASRIQGATKYLHSRILVSQNTASRIHTTLVGRRICSVRVQNINEPVSLYELREDSVESMEKDDRYETALKAFEGQRYDEAIQLLAQILSASTDDGPSKLLMARVIQSQLGGNFDPVWTLPGK